MEWKVVFTSPMRRAIETTVHMFKNHPNKSSIKFIVLPILREAFHTSCDLSIDVFELMKMYGDPEKVQGIKFDFSRLLSYGIP